MLLAMALGLTFAPGVMELNPAWEMLVAIAPQPVWAILGTVLAGLQIAAHHIRGRAYRMTVTIFAGAWWWALTVGQIYVWPLGAGMFIYGLLAGLNLLSIYVISTERYHPRTPRL